MSGFDLLTLVCKLMLPICLVWGSIVIARRLQRPAKLMITGAIFWLIGDCIFESIAIAIETNRAYNPELIPYGGVAAMLGQLLFCIALLRLYRSGKIQTSGNKEQS